MRFRAPVTIMTAVITLAASSSKIAAAAPPTSFEVWVSPDSGNDSAAGTTPASPLRHLRAARNRVRALRAGNQQLPAVIWLLPGTYRLNETLNLTGVDSYTAWRRAPLHGDSGGGSQHWLASLPVISGGRELAWAEAAPSGSPKQSRSDSSSSQPCKLVRAAGIPPLAGAAGAGGVYPELYIEGRGRAAVVRQPANAVFDPHAFFDWQPATPATAGAFMYNVSEVDTAGWGPDATAFVATAPWAFNPARIAAAAGGRVSLHGPLGPKPLTASSAGQGRRRWCALNTQGADLRAGEFRYSSARQEITFNYCPDASQPPLPAASVALPGLATLVSVQEGAVGISFEQLRFSHSAVGANPSPYSYDAPQSGAVEVANASQIRFTSVAFVSTGANGLQVRHGVQRVLVSGCVFLDIGGRGFTTTLEHTNDVQDAADVLVSDNVFQGCGKVFMQQPFCIFLTGRRNITVIHNDISDVAYSAIRVWAWNVQGARLDEFNSGTAAVFNVSFNHISKAGTGLLSDFGAVFVTSRPGHPDCVSTWGQGKCAVAALIHGNVIHQVRHFDHSGIGLYTDESSSLANLTGNLVFDCGSWGLHLHCGTRHTVRNNIFAGNAAQPPDGRVETYAERGHYAAEPFCNFRSHPTSSQGAALHRNIFDQRDAPLAGLGRRVSIFNNLSAAAPRPSVYGNVSNTVVGMRFSSNVYSFAEHVVAQFPGGRALEEWQNETGEDPGSVAGSPGFAHNLLPALARRDFRVDPSRSAALRAVGFQPLDLASVGPRRPALQLATCANDGGDAGVWWRGCVMHHSKPRQGGV
jgi:hypothetical protein